MDQAKENQDMGESLTANQVSPTPSTMGGAGLSGGAGGGDEAPRHASYDEYNDHPTTSHGHGTFDSEYEDGSQSDKYSDDDEDQDYSDDDEEDDEDDGDEPPLSLDELLYSASSYHAIIQPVSATMILAALASVYINTDASRQFGEEQFASAYNVWQVDNDGSGHAGKNLIVSVGNTLVMVLVIGTMTFGIVLLYKYRCMKFLIGYMIFSSASLLGLLGDYMASIAIQVYHIPIDKITYTIFMYNFAIVGVISIFYQNGIPYYITQIYLVCTSVILAWHLSHFDDWTAWTLLVMLALYDLCAVLTPCGPLKALVNLMSAKDAPDMPGLLYEAHLPVGTQKPGAGNNNVSRKRSDRRSSQEDAGGGNNNEEEEEQQQQQSSSQYHQQDESKSRSSSNTPLPAMPAMTENAQLQPPQTSNSDDAIPLPFAEPSFSNNGPHAFLPLAIAKVYRLPLVSRYTYGVSNSSSSTRSNRRKQRKQSSQRKRRTRGAGNEASSTINESPLLAENHSTEEEKEETTEEFYKRDFTVAELLSEVEVELPRSGGRIENVEGSRNRFLVIGRNGNVKRELYMNKKGKVYDVTEDDDDDSVYDEDPASIRLGLGDFIFYSVLVSKAAMYSFTTFAACMLVILAGLGATLVFLSIYHSALPALPISIFLGVIFYLLTRVLIEPWVELVVMTPIYV